MIIIAFVVGYMCSGMMKKMCGSRLVEGKTGEMTKSGYYGIFSGRFWKKFDNI
jgi:hypothetical protein